MDKPIHEAVRNPNIAVIEQARDTFPEGHYLRGALDHAAAEVAVLSNRLRRADATAAQQQGQAVAALTTVRFLDGGVVQMDRSDYNNLIAAPPSAPVGADDWKNAVLNALAGTGMDAPLDEPPYSIQNRIIRWHEDVATDPVLAQQPAAVDEAKALPHEAGPFARDGSAIYSGDFRHDAALSVTGDFASEEERFTYCDWVAAVLNAAVLSALATQHQEPTT